MPLFDKFNDAFEVLIDTYESDYIKPENIDEAIKLAKEFASQHEDSEYKEAIIRVINAAILARQNKVWLIFDF